MVLHGWGKSVHTSGEALEFEQPVWSKHHGLIVWHSIGEQVDTHTRRDRVSFAQAYSAAKSGGGPYRNIADIDILAVIFGGALNNLCSQTTRRERLHLAVEIPDPARRDIGDRKPSILIGSDAHLRQNVLGVVVVRGQTDLGVRDRLAVLHETSPNNRSVCNRDTFSLESSRDRNQFGRHPAWRYLHYRGIQRFGVSDLEISLIVRDCGEVDPPHRAECPSSSLLINRPVLFD